MKDAKGLLRELGYVDDLAVLEKEYQEAKRKAEGKSIFSEEYRRVQSTGIRLWAARMFRESMESMERKK